MSVQTRHRKARTSELPGVAVLLPFMVERMDVNDCCVSYGRAFGSPFLRASMDLAQVYGIVLQHRRCNATIPRQAGVVWWSRHALFVSY